MPQADPRPNDDLLVPAASSPSAVSVSQFAHELNSLLDGSIRCVSQALRDLDEAAPASGLAPEPVIGRLRAANEAMRQMAELLERVGETSQPASALFDRRRPLADEVDRLLVSLEAMAEIRQVRIESTVHPAARRLPIGPLGPVIANGLRNAIEACGEGGGSGGRVRLAISLAEPGELVILVSDNGPGVPAELRPGHSRKPGGRGLGLEICRQIVSDLDGSLRLTDAPGGGAVFEVRLRVGRLSVP